MAAPIETKVQAATGAAAVSGLALWSLGHWVFKAGVPDVVASWVYVLIPGVLAFGAGYLAKHTDRPAVPPVITMGTGGGGGEDVAGAAPAGNSSWSNGPTWKPPEKAPIPPAVPQTDQPGAAGAGGTP